MALQRDQEEMQARKSTVGDDHDDDDDDEERSKVGSKGITLRYLPGRRGNLYYWGNCRDTRGCIIFSAPCQPARTAHTAANWSERVPVEQPVSADLRIFAAAAPASVVFPAATSRIRPAEGAVCRPRAPPLCLCRGLG